MVHCGYGEVSIKAIFHVAIIICRQYNEIKNEVTQKLIDAGREIHMKKKTIIMIGIIGIIVLFGIIMLIDLLIYRLRGDISVTINGEEYLVKQLECTYEDGKIEKVTYGKAFMDSGVAFKNSGSSYGMYEYIFLINKEEINIEPKIRVFKTNWYDMYIIDIGIDIYEDNGVWNADVSVKTNLTTYQETFYDIENNAIEMRVE